MGKVQKREWLPSDTALWQTCHIVHDLRNSRVPSYRADTFFPLGENEIALASGKILGEAYRSNGDGSYVHSSGFAFGFGPLGWALMAGTLAGSAAGNSRRRREAAANAAADWRFDFSGIVVVTSLGFVLQTRNGLFRWDWASIELMQVMEYNRVVMQGRAATGQVTWRLTSEWAELIFVLWALSQHPQHPQFRDGSWLPAGWIEWAILKGYRPHLGQAVIEM